MAATDVTEVTWQLEDLLSGNGPEECSSLLAEADQCFQRGEATVRLVEFLTRRDDE